MWTLIIIVIFVVLMLLLSAYDKIDITSHKNAKSICVQVISPVENIYYSAKLIRRIGVCVVVCTCCIFVEDSTSNKIDIEKLSSPIPHGRYLIVFNKNEIIDTKIGRNEHLKLSLDKRPFVEDVKYVNINKHTFPISTILLSLLSEMYTRLERIQL